MADKTTIKVVSQILNLRFHGTATRSTQVAASKMASLLGVRTDSGKPVSSKQTDSSRSYTLYQGTLDNLTNPGGPTSEVGPIRFVFEDALAYFDSLEDPAAAGARKKFFKAVEDGKKNLREKYGERIPNEAIYAMAQSVEGVACTIWKHQIVTTRTSDSQFKEARRNRDGSWTATVRSRTIYTMVALSDAQLEELKQIVLGQRSGSHLGKRKSIKTTRGWKSSFVSENGNVVFREEGGHPPPGTSASS